MYTCHSALAMLQPIGNFAVATQHWASQILFIVLHLKCAVTSSCNDNSAYIPQQLHVTVNRVTLTVNIMVR